MVTTNAGAHPGGTHRRAAAKDDYLMRLRRIEGQTRGLQHMVEQEKPCIDILTQFSALTSALRSLAVELLDEHLRERAAEAEMAPELVANDLSEAIRRLLRPSAR
ncbi:metal-sensitive transcriptional regulator [Nocardia asiatica]